MTSVSDLKLYGNWLFWKDHYQTQLMFMILLISLKRLMLTHSVKLLSKILPVPLLVNLFTDTLTKMLQKVNILSLSGILLETLKLILDCSMEDKELLKISNHADSTQTMLTFLNSTKNQSLLNTQSATPLKLLNSLNPVISYLSFVSNGLI